MKLDYIPTEFGKTWVSSRFEARRGIHTPLAYIDINEGNRYDADVFAQIMYWHEPSAETGKQRLTQFHDGQWWLAKNHSDWFAETRIKVATIRKCLDRLKQRKLIFYELHGFEGDKTPYIRVNWDEFERRMKLWQDNNHALLSEKEYDKATELYIPVTNTPDTKYQPPCPEISAPLLPNNIPLIPEVKPNTETTTETTPETTVVVVNAPVLRLGNPEPEQPRPTIYTLYEQRIGLTLNDTNRQKLVMLEQEHGSEKVSQAIEITAERRNSGTSIKAILPYVEGILDNQRAQEAAHKPALTVLPAKAAQPSERSNYLTFKPKASESEDASA